MGGGEIYTRTKKGIVACKRVFSRGVRVVSRPYSYIKDFVMA